MLNNTPGFITREASPAPPPQYTIPVHISERDNVRHEPPATPAQQMTQTTILQATDYLLTRDSTIKQISPDKMNTGEYLCVQKICVPSMKTIDLLHWLDQLQPNTKISRLVLHIGVNDCKGGEINTEQWTTLLTKINTTFPAASLIVSSIIPARGRHLMNPAILSSNRNLHSVCNALKITFVDNTSTFVAKRNAPPHPPPPPRPL